MQFLPELHTETKQTAKEEGETIENKQLNSSHTSELKQKGLMVDVGPTPHGVTDIKRFLEFKEAFKSTLQKKGVRSADGLRLVKLA